MSAVSRALTEMIDSTAVATGRRVVVLEPYPNGHRAAYARWLVDSIRMLGHTAVLVGGPDVLASAPIQQAIASAGADRLLLLSLAPPANGPAVNGLIARWRRELRFWSWFRDACSLSTADDPNSVIVVPYLDYCLPAFATLGAPFEGRSWAGILMGLEFPVAPAASSARALLGGYFVRRLLQREPCRILSLDPVSDTARLESAWRGRRGSLMHLADPADAPESRRFLRPTAELEGRRRILVYGAIDPRKGLLELVEGLRALDDSERWTLHIAGLPTAAGSRLIAALHATAHRFELVVDARYLNEAETEAAFAAADVVWIAYPGHRGASGVLIQSALNARPVIANDAGLLGRLVQERYAGVVCNPRSPASVAAALRDATSEPVRSAAAGLPERFAAHSLQRFGATIGAAISALSPPLSGAIEVTAGRTGVRLHQAREAPAVQIQQPTIPHYRVPVFDALAARLDGRLLVCASPTVPGGPNSDPAPREYADLSFECRSFVGSRLLWQRGMKLNVAKDGVVVVGGNPRYLTSLSLARAARRAGVGLVVWTHGWSASSRSWSAALRVASLRFCDCVLAYTDAEVPRLKSLLPNVPVIAAQNAVDLTEIDAARRLWSADSLQDFKRREGLVGRTVLAFCGRLRRDPPTGVRILLDAVAELVRTDSTILLVVIGDGDDRVELETHAAALGIAPHIRWLGAMYAESEKAPWLMSASCFTFPGAIGLSLMQAFAYGLPAVTHSDARRHGPEFAAMAPDHNGLTFRPGDVSALASCIARICADPALRATLATNARRTVTEEYSLDNMITRMTSAIEIARARAAARRSLRATH